jgi:hypothetical protein
MYKSLLTAPEAVKLKRGIKMKIVRVIYLASISARKING